MAFLRSSSVCWFHSLKPMYREWNPLSRKKSDRAFNRSSALMPKSSPVNFEYRIHFTYKPRNTRSVELPARRAAAFLALGSLALAFAGDESGFLIAADA